MHSFVCVYVCVNKPGNSIAADTQLAPEPQVEAAQLGLTAIESVKILTVMYQICTFNIINMAVMPVLSYSSSDYR